ncbi:MAG: sigma-70 family RNA polymerase sigma factor [Candidatus Omnitrophica bacterium]|nr:sigma-70 family RNA polymerase sigma factor [Candidatus Omnitrophota bacterium]
MEFETLLNRIGPKLKGITRCLDRKYALFSNEDLYQEAVGHLWEEYCAHRFTRRNESYILHGCYYFLKNFIRKSSRTLDRRTLSLHRPSADEYQEYAERIPERGPDSFSRLNARICERDLDRLLDPRELKIIRLRLAGYTAREIGAQLGISHVMVAKLRARIREKCRAIKKELVRM